MKVDEALVQDTDGAVSLDSPVHTSSSDDFAAIIEAELQSSSDSDSSKSSPIEEADDTEIDRSKRCKVEHAQTVEEIDSPSSMAIQEEEKVIVCDHPGSFGGICFVCGQKLEESGVSFRYIHKGICLDPEEVGRLRDQDMESLIRRGKLCLVLDLDHTLLNSTALMHMRSEEEYLKNITHSLQDVSEGSLFLLEFMHTMTKLRPFIRPFLRETSKIFELYIYTMGDRLYARQMAKLLDPKGEYFGDRIISRDDGTVKHQKSLDIVLGQESVVLILDDSENAWPNHRDNLILMERYHFFASSCQQFGHNFKSHSQMKRDESEADGALATVLKVLKKIHRLFFEGIGEDNNLSNRDVRLVLKQVRREILKDCKIVFSRVTPMNHEPERHHLWNMAEQLGATCVMDVDPFVTHVVAMDVGTEKSRWAVREKKFLVHPGWIEAANFLWRKQSEESFLVEESKEE